MARPIDADRLKDAIYTDFWEHFTQCHDSDQTALIDMVMYDIDEMPTLIPPNEWVRVEERLPEKKQDVLMLFKSGNMAVGWWHDADEHITFWCAYTDDGFYTDCDDMPTHWMPLPAPPNRRLQEGEA